MPTYQVTRSEHWMVEKKMTYEVEADNEMDAIKVVEHMGDGMIPVHEQDVDFWLDDVPSHPMEVEKV